MGRFPLKIDPKTPVKDLLPTPPQVKKAGKPVLIGDLSHVPEIHFQLPLSRDLQSMEAMKQTAHTIARINFLNSKKTDAFLETLLKERSDLLGLPYAMGDQCRTKGERSRQLTRAVNLVRQCLQTMVVPAPVINPPPPVQESRTVSPTSVVTQFGPFTPPGAGGANRGDSFWETFHAACTNEDRGTSRLDREHQECVTVARVAALMQILAPESASLRLGLVKYLSATAHVEATRALARLVLFSAEDEVRQAAVDALKVRRERDYTEILLSGLRYPYPAVARRAGDALVKLERTDLIPQLLDVLEQPDPRAPQVKEMDDRKVTVVREMVRINHHRNCLLCHAPGTTSGVTAETLTAGVPVPSEPLPSSFDGYRQTSPDLLVRIDVTYLRQDFSLLQPVEDSGQWPQMQRFDFFVRTRVLNEEEVEAHRDLFKQQEPGRLSPYHRAALSALRELTGKDAEPTAEAWRKLLHVPKGRKTASF